jgi:hypothetical protein
MSQKTARTLKFPRGHTNELSLYMHATSLSVRSSRSRASPFIYTCADDITFLKLVSTVPFPSCWNSRHQMGERILLQTPANAGTHSSDKLLITLQVRRPRNRGSILDRGQLQFSSPQRPYRLWCPPSPMDDGGGGCLCLMVKLRGG